MKKLIDYQEGDELFGRIITKVYGATNKYIVYETENMGNVAYHTVNTINAIELLKPIRPILTDIFELVTTKKVRLKFAFRVATAYMCCFNENPKTALKILEKTNESVINSKKFRSKLFYLSSCLVLVILNLVIAYLINDVFVSYLSSTCILLFTIATFGSIGGFLSVSININKLDLDIYSGAIIQIVLGLTRIFIAMLSSLIIFAIIKSNLVLGIINDVNNNYIFYTLAVVSGFSETFVPNIIKYIEKEKSPKE